MPILFQISIEVNTGSVGRIAEQIGEKVLSEGWESYISYAMNCLPSKSQLVKIGTKWDVYVHGLQTRLFDNHCLSSKNATQNLIKEIERISPDIIQLHHIHGYFLNMEVLFNYLATLKIPVVWVLHDCWSFTGHCAYFDYVDCSKWKTECYDCPNKNEYPKSLFIDASRRNYKIKKKLFNLIDNMTIVPVSYWLSNLVKDSFLSKYPIQTIQNGIDIEQFCPQGRAKNDLGISSKVCILGVASTWDRRKGLNDFVKLAKIMPNDWQIVLVGLSKKQIRQMPDNILGLERTESVKQLAELYSVADVFVNATWEDTFPTTNLEALACGTPVVTYNTGGSVESVSNETGLIVEKGDIRGLLESILLIINKGRSYYTNQCRDRAVNLYNKNDRFKDYIKLYKKLLEVSV